MDMEDEIKLQFATLKGEDGREAKLNQGDLALICSCMEIAQSEIATCEDTTVWNKIESLKCRLLEIMSPDLLKAYNALRADAERKKGKPS